MEIYGVNFKNYKSLINNNVIFKEKKGFVKKIIAIYGENGAGKSNVIDSLSNLALSIRTLDNLNEFIKFRSKLMEQVKNDNLNMKDIEKVLPPIFSEYSSVNKVYADSHTIGEKGTTEIEYLLNLDNKIGKYKLTFSEENKLISESFYHVVREKRGLLFQIVKEKDKMKLFLSPVVFKNKKLKDEIKMNVEKYWGKHTFFSILESEFKNYNPEFIATNVSKHIVNMVTGLKNISIFKKTKRGEIIGNNSRLLRRLGKGTIDVSEKEKLKSTENIIDTFFSSCYKDIQSAFYKTEFEDNGKINYLLCFKKRIGGKDRNIPYQLESGGTKRLLKLLPLIISAVLGNIVLIDEIDQGIHDILISSILSALDSEVKGQLIFTTHNTELMHTLTKSEVYLINSDLNGKKEIYSLSEFKIQPNNNIPKMYLDGKFDGVPYTNFSMLEEAIDLINSEENSNEID